MSAARATRLLAWLTVALVTLDVVVSTNARYRAVFTNAAGSATTQVATLKVAKSAPVITTHPAPVRA